MPIAQISFAESALSDLAGIQTWYREEGVPEVGDRFVSEIFERVQTLAEHPDIGRIVPEFGQPLLRELIHPPFRIVYRREPHRVRIVRIWRSERLLRLPP
jgi:plasmid stabilization system protein ParE